MKTSDFPSPSQEFLKAEQSLQEANQLVAEAKAKLQNVSSPNYSSEDNVERQAAMQRGEMPSGPRKTTAMIVTEAANELDDAQEVRQVRKGIFDVQKAREEQRVRDALRPVVEVEERKISEGLLQIFEALRLIEQIKGKLVARDFGHWGQPCKLDVDRLFKDSAIDRASEFAQVLRQAVSLNYIKPVEGL